MAYREEDDGIKTNLCRNGYNFFNDTSVRQNFQQKKVAMVVMVAKKGLPILLFRKKEYEKKIPTYYCFEKGIVGT